MAICKPRKTVSRQYILGLDDFKEHNIEALSDTTFRKGHHNQTRFKKQKFK